MVGAKQTFQLIIISFTQSDHIVFVGFSTGKTINHYYVALFYGYTFKPLRLYALYYTIHRDCKLKFAPLISITFNPYPATKFFHKFFAKLESKTGSLFIFSSWHGVFNFYTEQ